MDKDSPPADTTTDSGLSDQDTDTKASQNDGKAPAADSQDTTSKDKAQAKADKEIADNLPSTSDDKKSEDDVSTDTKTDEKEAPAFDKDLDKWAEERGYGTLDNDKERRLAQDARNQQSMQRTRAEARKTAQKLAEDVGKTTQPDANQDDDVDPLVLEVRTLSQRLETSETNRRTSDYFGAMVEAGSPVSEAEVEAMGNLLKQTAETDGKPGVDFLLKDIGRWHYLAKADLDTGEKSADVDAEAVKQEEREKIAKKSKAGGPATSAKKTSAQERIDPFLKGLMPEAETST